MIFKKETFIEVAPRIPSDEDLMEMAILTQNHTGMQPTIIVLSKYSSEGKSSQHGARVKVSNVDGRFAHDDNFTITVGKYPLTSGICKLSRKTCDDFVKWVRLNHDHLINVWENGHNLDPIDLIKRFKKV